MLLLKNVNFKKSLESSLALPCMDFRLFVSKLPMSGGGHCFDSLWMAFFWANVLYCTVVFCFSLSEASLFTLLWYQPPTFISLGVWVLLAVGWGRGEWHPRVSPLVPDMSAPEFFGHFFVVTCESGAAKDYFFAGPKPHVSRNTLCR